MICRDMKRCALTYPQMAHRPASYALRSAPHPPSRAVAGPVGTCSTTELIVMVPQEVASPPTLRCAAAELSMARTTRRTIR